MAPSRPFYPTAAALGSVLLFSTGGLCIKIIPLSALTISGLRSLLAVFFFLVLLAGRGTGLFAFRLGRLGWVIAVSYAMVVTLFVAATKLTTAANAIFLQYTMPAWVLVGGAIWLHERVTFGRIASILCCLLGMALFFQGELNPSDWQGNTIALLAGFFFAVMTLCIRLERDHQPLVAVFVGNLITAATNLPLAVWFFPHDFSSLHGARVWLGLCWLGFFQIGLAYIFFTFALKGLPAIEVAILSLLEPILNPTLVFFSIGETPAPWAIVGGIIILFSVLIRLFFVEEDASAREPAPS